jgi:hypothetical protein
MCIIRTVGRPASPTAKVGSLPHFIRCFSCLLADARSTIQLADSANLLTSPPT